MAEGYAAIHATSRLLAHLTGRQGMYELKVIVNPHFRCFRRAVLAFEFQKARNFAHSLCPIAALFHDDHLLFRCHSRASLKFGQRLGIVSRHDFYKLCQRAVPIAKQTLSALAARIKQMPFNQYPQSFGVKP